MDVETDIQIQLTEEEIKNSIDLLEERAEEITALLADRAFATLEARITHFERKAEQVERQLNAQQTTLGDGYVPLFGRAIQIRAKVQGISVSVKNLQPSRPISGTNPRTDDDTCSQASTSANTSASNCYQAVSLKKFHLPTFNGDLKNYREFIETFRTAVHNKNYHDVDKINFLFDVLRGPAREAVRGYDRIASNYPVVLDLLKERFGDESKLVNVYYSELERLQPGTSSASQRANLDTIRKILTNLEAIGTNVDQEYLKALILRKFNRETLVAALSQLVTTPGEKFSVEKAIETLTSVVQIRELADNFLSEDSSSVKRSIGYPGALTAARKFSNSGNNTAKCAFCNGAHRPSDCTQFGTVKDRRRVIQDNKLCFFCLSARHSPNQCRIKDTPCSFCQQKGHAKHTCISFLSSTQAPSEPKRARIDHRNKHNPSVQRQRRSTHDAKTPTGIFLETFIALIKTNDNCITVRGVMDSCSSYSYISEELVKRVGLRTTKTTKLEICLFGNTEPYSILSGEVRITLINTEKTIQKTLNFMSTPCITGNMETSPPVSMVEKVLPKRLKYADPDLFNEIRQNVDLIVGNNYQYTIYTGHLKPINYGVILRQSIFGWIPTGAIQPTKSNDLLPTYHLLATSSQSTPVLLSSKMSHANANLTASSSQKLLQTTNILGSEINVEVLPLDNLWILENLGIKSSELEESDDFVLKNFRNVVRFENNRFVVRWPWKQENPHIQSNFRMCMARLKSLIARSTPHLLNEYDNLLKDQLSQGIIEPAPKTTHFLTHYLPHRALLKKDKIRVVYDASAKTKTGHSLNDLLHKGPVLLEDLVGLLLNFRMNAVALTADIEKAFLQVGLNEVDRDVVRFIWLKNISLPITPDNMIIYRFARVPFGVISSPFLLSMVLHELLSTPPINDWYTIAKNKFYVDNLVMSVDTTTDAINANRIITAKLRSASFNLRDWTSNDQGFLKAIGQPPLTESSEKISILGLYWDRFQDNLFIQLQPIETPELKVTKRIVLKFYASVYDPLGFFGLCTLPLKLLLQKCWKLKYDWDTPLPSDLIAQWMKSYSECINIPTIPIPRRYWSFSDKGEISLHIFCDASKYAYACCAYLVYKNPYTFNTTSTLTFTKVKIAPVPTKKMQELTIPKLELLAVLIGTRTAVFLKRRLDMMINCTVIWTDATTVLQWLNSSRIQPTFIQNRIDEIRKVKSITIRHVPTDCNPADIASRGCKTDSIKNDLLWWHGPSWLCHEELWPAAPNTTQTFSPLLLPIPPVLLITPYQYNGILTDALEKRFRHWNAYIRIFKYVNRFRFRHLSANPPTSLEEFNTAEMLLITEIQKKYFHSELTALKRNKQPNSELDLFLDKGIIRCKGRLENASFPWDTIHPILLPRDSPLIDCYLRDLHRTNFHIGCTHLLAKLRERFWITKARAKINSIIYRCTICRRIDGGSYTLPPLPPLPLFRLAEASPFLHTGVDYTGAITIRNDVGELIKVYVVVYVCLVTRAIHLEIAINLSGEEFLLNLIKFGSIRGRPQIIISDNATNFTFVQPLVGRKVTVSDPKVDLYLNTNSIQWKFIPQYAPWHGGAYERLVGLVKKGLKKAYGTSYLDYVQLSTVLYQLADTINSRPLTYVSSKEILSPLTPNHFLRLRRTNAALPIEVTARELPSTTKNLITAWTDTCEVIDKFWEVFRKQYLLSLREKHTVNHPTVKGSVPFLPTQGDIVLVQEPSAPRLEWRFGVIERVSQRHSLAVVRCNGKTITRSVNQLYPLELPTNVNDREHCRENQVNPERNDQEDDHNYSQL